MAIVPTTYRFIKESNGNVLVNAYDGATPIGILASLNPAKNLSKSERFPEQVVIPIDVVVAHANNRFLSIPYDKIDLANSTPANTNPTSVSDAIDKLQSDFFFDVGGGSGITPNLQQVTDEGNTTTNSINGVFINDLGQSGNLFNFQDTVFQNFSWSNGVNSVTLNQASLTDNREYILTDVNGVIGAVTGPVNSDPQDSTVSIKIPFAADAAGTVYYILASTNND